MVNNKPITIFRNEYEWLSNFYPCKIVDKYGNVYPSSEHAYISAKLNTDIWRKYCTDENITAGDLKRQSKNLVPTNWHKIKVKIMYRILVQKFNQEPFKTTLINTGDCMIYEGNWWNDKFWGVDYKTLEGENTLGKLIMKIRNEINRATIS